MNPDSIHKYNPSIDHEVADRPAARDRGSHSAGDNTATSTSSTNPPSDEPRQQTSDRRGGDADDEKDDAPPEQQTDGTDSIYTLQAEDVTDSAGNSISAYTHHNYLKQLFFIGLDARRTGVFYNESRQQIELVSLNEKGNIERMSAGIFYGDTLSEHVVNFATEFGPWSYVNPALVKQIEQKYDPDELPDSDEIMAETTDDSYHVSRHATNRWEERRGEGVDEGVEEAWMDGLSFNWPSDTGVEEARLHPETTCVFIANAKTIITTYPPLSSVSPELQQDIREELIEASIVVSNDTVEKVGSQHSDDDPSEHQSNNEPTTSEPPAGGASSLTSNIDRSRYKYGEMVTETESE